MLTIFKYYYLSPTNEVIIALNNYNKIVILNISTSIELLYGNGVGGTAIDL